ncbi:MAG: SRPBCC domain-containing protein [Myxococcota bacterium]|nr:SRPBCC domain-containing protein [Myxococcota bacterium]
MAELQLSVDVPTTPQKLWEAYMDTLQQAAITGAPASVEAKIGGNITLYSGAVTGVFVALRKPDLIVQTWRTHDFEDQEPDARTEIRLAPSARGCRFIVTQDNIPQRLRKQFINGWTTAYFKDLQTWAVRSESP